MTTKPPLFECNKKKKQNDGEKNHDEKTKKE